MIGAPTKKSRHIGRSKPVNYTAVPSGTIKPKRGYRKEPLPESIVQLAQAKDTQKAGAAPKTERVDLGLTERVIDMLWAMFKRRQISDRQYRAADYYRAAFQSLDASMGNSMDMDRSRGGSVPGGPPSPHMFVAGEIVRRVRERLSGQQFAVVYRICIAEMTIEKATEQLYGTPYTRAQRDACSKVLKDALDVLANHWWPMPRSGYGNMRSEVMERAGITDATHDPSSPMNSGSVHVTGNKVYRGGKS